MKYLTNCVFEIPLTDKSQFVTFTRDHDAYVWRVPTFQKADGVTYVRFSASTAGTYHYTASNKNTTFSVAPYEGDNPLLAHGAITAKKDEQYLHHSDGTPFFWLADTWWYGMTNRMAWPNPFQHIVADRKTKGFTVAYFVVGIPPEIDAFSEHAANEGGTAFNQDWTLNPAYFDAVDQRISYLVDQGIMPCIFGSWGNHIDWMGADAVKNLWREIIARYGAYPVILSICGEADVMVGAQGTAAVAAQQAKQGALKIFRYLPKPAKTVLVKAKHRVSRLVQTHRQADQIQKRLAVWSDVATYVANLDPYQRPRTIHVAALKRASELFGNPSWLTIDSIQSGHGTDRAGFMVDALATARRPIINLEPWYEGITGNFYGHYQRYVFWVSLLSGACGHSYGAHGIWQMATDSDHFMAHWGDADWHKALQFTGPEDLANAKQFLTTIPWWQLTCSDALISPQATEPNPWLPVTAQTPDYIISYIPDTSIKTVMVRLTNSPGFRTATWYCLKNFTVLGTSAIRGTQASLPLPKSNMETDLLLVLTK